MNMTTRPDSTEIELSPIVRSEINDLLKRPKKVTINDVARLAQVSKKTISRIINNAPNVNEETRIKVNLIIGALGYKPDPQARALAFRRSFLLGLIYDNPNAHYVVNMQMGILDHLKDTGHELVVHPCDRRAPEFLENIRDFIERQRLMGVILLPPIAEDRALIDLIQSLNIPLIRITARSGQMNDPPIDTAQILSQDRIGCEQASEHLIRLGHRKIGYIAGNLAYASAHERRLGFEAGLARLGYAFDPAYDEQGDYSFESGYEAALRLLSRTDRPTAIISCNDEMAAGIYKAAYELGLTIPNDLSIVSFDDSHLAIRLSPGLSTIRLPTRSMGAQAAQALLSQKSGLPQSFAFESKLIIRNSSGPLPE